MKHRYLLWSLLSFLSLAFVLVVQVQAHSTAGKKKRVIHWATLKIDDLAYYLEPWVNGTGMGDIHKIHLLYVEEFKQLVQSDNRVSVLCKITDFKTKESFEWKAYFERGPDGTWAHLDETGGVINAPIYTYNNPPFPGGKMGIGLAGGAGVLFLCGLIIARNRWRRRRDVSTGG